MKAMAGAMLHEWGAFVWEAAESTSGCERDPRLGCRVVRDCLSDTPVLDFRTGPNFDCREKIFPLVDPPSEAECWTVCELGR